MSIKRINPDEESESQRQRSDGTVASPVHPYFTYTLVASLVVVFLIQLASGLEKSYGLADSFHPAIFRGEYWRLITGATMHASVTHAFMNCLALFNLGSAIEYLSNRAHLAIVFILAVIGGAVLSLYWTPGVSAVGASGGIVGLLGYLAVYSYKRRKLLPPSLLRNMLLNLCILVGIGIIFPFVDNAAHLGGLIVGAAYGFIQIPSDLHEDPRTVDTVTAILGYACLIAFLSFALLTILLLRKIITL